MINNAVNSINISMRGESYQVMTTFRRNISGNVFILKHIRLCICLNNGMKTIPEIYKMLTETYYIKMSKKPLLLYTVQLEFMKKNKLLGT